MNDLFLHIISWSVGIVAGLLYATYAFYTYTVLLQFIDTGKQKKVMYQALGGMVIRFLGIGGGCMGLTVLFSLNTLQVGLAFVSTVLIQSLRMLGKDSLWK